MEVYLKDISQKFGSEHIFRNITFSIKEGECILIYGKNGTGKTTLLKILNLLEYPDKGEINYFVGNHIYTFRKGMGKNLQIQRKMVLVPQKYVIFNNSVYYNLKIGLKLRNEKFSEKDLERMLRVFDIWALKDKWCMQLSSGEKQKVSLIRSLILGCELFLLDEPTNHLDETSKQILKQLIIEKKNMGKSFIVTTPDFKEWEDFIFDRIYLFREEFLYDITSKSKKDSVEYCQSIFNRKDSATGMLWKGSC